MISGDVVTLQAQQHVRPLLSPLDGIIILVLMLAAWVNFFPFLQLPFFPDFLFGSLMVSTPQGHIYRTDMKVFLQGSDILLSSYDLLSLASLLLASLCTDSPERKLTEMLKP